MKITEEIELAVEPVRHGVDIADVDFSPGLTVKAGRSLLTTVLLENFGDKVEKDVKVTVEIPELGVSAVEYVDVLPDDCDECDEWGQRLSELASRFAFVFRTLRQHRMAAFVRSASTFRRYDAGDLRICVGCRG